MQKIDKRKILRDNEWKKDKNGKYINPESGRKFTESKALDTISRKSGFKDYDSYKSFRKTAKYKEFEKLAKEKDIDTTLGGKFSKNYASWKKAKFKHKTKQMRDLLKHLKLLKKKNYERYI